MAKVQFPEAKKRIEDFLYEEEGNIPRSKMLTLGTMVLLLTLFYASEAFAAHRSHTSHSSHKSHSSHRSGSHSSHSSSTHSNQVHDNVVVEHNSGVHNNGTHSNSFENSSGVDIGAPSPEDLPLAEPVEVEGFRLPPPTEPNTFAADMNKLPLSVSTASIVTKEG